MNVLSITSPATEYTFSFCRFICCAYARGSREMDIRVFDQERMTDIPDGIIATIFNRGYLKVVLSLHIHQN